MSHPFKNHSVFSTWACPCSQPSASDCYQQGAPQAFIYRGNNGWGPQPFGTLSHMRGPSPLHAAMCLCNGLHPGWACAWLLVPITRRQGRSGKGWCCGRSKKGHPGAVGLPTGLPVCVWVYRAAERTVGDAGAGFLGKLSSVQSSSLAKQGPARERPGSVGHGWREATSCTADAAGAKRGARGEQLPSTRPGHCKLVQGANLFWSGVSPFGSYLPITSMRRSPQGSPQRAKKSSTARKRKPLGLRCSLLAKNRK